jgi:hypothetical protein
VKLKLAAEHIQLVVAAVGAAQAQEAMRQNAARHDGVELVLDELRQVGARCRCRPMACTRGSRSGEPAPCQAARCASKAVHIVYR